MKVLGMVSGINLPDSVTELRLPSGRFFKNPLLNNEKWNTDPVPNMTLYKEIDGKPHLDKDIVKYLVETVIDSDETVDIGNLNFSGSGSVTFHGTTGLTVGGDVKNSLEKVIPPLRLATSARIIVVRWVFFRAKLLRNRILTKQCQSQQEHALSRP